MCVMGRRNILKVRSVYLSCEPEQRNFYLLRLCWHIICLAFMFITIKTHIKVIVGGEADNFFFYIMYFQVYF